MYPIDELLITAIFIWWRCGAIQRQEYESRKAYQIWC